MSRLRTFPAVLTLMLFPLMTNATSLYTAEVVVNGNSSKAEQLAKQEGLREILVRVSGKEQTMESPQMIDSLKKVDQFISQVAYDNIAGERIASFSYNSERILSLLADAKASLWAQPRPEVVFWLVDGQNSNDKYIVWDQSTTPLVGELRSAGLRRGLPIVIPVGDIEDITTIAPIDLWGSFVGPVVAASKRYSPTGIVIAKIYQDKITWQFFPDVEEIESIPAINGEAPLPTTAAAMNKMVDSVSEYYAEQFAITMGMEGRSLFVLELTGIVDPQDFFAAEKILKSFNSVENIQLKSVDNGVISYGLTLIGDESLFHAEMVRHDEFAPIKTEQAPVPSFVMVGEDEEISDVTDALEQENEVTTLTYQWQ